MYYFTGTKWQSRRKLLGNAFHLKNLEMYLMSMNKHSSIFTNKLLEASAKNEEIALDECISLCSLDIICGN